MKTTTKTAGKSKTKAPGKESAPAAKIRRATVARKARPSSIEARPAPERSTKLQQCLNLLNTAEGATIDELQSATGWQAHSVRGFLAGTVKKKLGLILNSKKAEDGVRRYHVVKAEA